MRLSIIFLLSILIFSCKNQKAENSNSTQESVKDTIATSNDSIKDFREFKVLDSKYINFSKLWEPFENYLNDFTEETYNNLKPLVLEADIPTLQKLITEQKLTYVELTKFYLYRIRKFDRENPLSLN